MAVGAGEIGTEGVEAVNGHAAEEMGEDALLGAVVGVEVELHQHQQRGVAQEAEDEGAGAAGVADELYQGVAGCEGSVEVESVDVHRDGASPRPSTRGGAYEVRAWEFN